MLQRIEEMLLGSFKKPFKMVQWIINEGNNLVYIIGGDGTINEVLNGYVVGEGYEKNVILCPLSSGLLLLNEKERAVICASL